MKRIRVHFSLEVSLTIALAFVSGIRFVLSFVFLLLKEVKKNSTMIVEVF